jgi:hypothetical protein
MNYSMLLLERHSRKLYFRQSVRYACESDAQQPDIVDMRVDVCRSSRMMCSHVHHDLNRDVMHANGDRYRQRGTRDMSIVVKYIHVLTIAMLKTYDYLA